VAGLRDIGEDTHRGTTMNRALGIIGAAIVVMSAQANADQPPKQLPPGMRLGPTAYASSVYNSVETSPECVTAIPGRNIDLGTLHMYEEGGCNNGGGTADQHYTTFKQKTASAICYTVTVRPATRTQRCSQRATLGYYLE
jgi:hypothetical protein